jgi:hypothetical protein
MAWFGPCNLARQPQATHLATVQVYFQFGNLVANKQVSDITKKQISSKTLKKI